MPIRVHAPLPRHAIAKKSMDRTTTLALAAPALASASMVVLIVVFIAIRGVSPFLPALDGTSAADIVRFLTGTTWYIAPNLYGILFVVIDTLYVVLLAALLAIPVAVFTALFVVKMAPRPLGALFATVVELLAAVPSIVYGVFGVGVVTKGVARLAEALGLQSAGGISTLATVIVLAIMIMPTIAIMSITALKAVDRDLENNSLALGATTMQTHFRISLPAARSGIFAGVILGIGRALGEATAVSMVAGNAGSGPNLSLFGTTRTLTSTMLLGLKETVGLDYDIRFSVGLVLIAVILASNLLLNGVKKRLGRFSS